jgi:Ni/Co efflux regulator RcnB
VRYSQFDADPFYFPAGYQYRRWRPGQYLPRVSLENRYRFTRYSTIGLRPPGRGRAWVRFGPDLLIVHTASGLIDDVIRDVFY